MLAMLVKPAFREGDFRKTTYSQMGDGQRLRGRSTTGGLVWWSSTQLMGLAPGCASSQVRPMDEQACVVHG